MHLEPHLVPRITLGENNVVLSIAYADIEWKINPTFISYNRLTEAVDCRSQGDKTMGEECECKGGNNVGGEELGIWLLW